MLGLSEVGPYLYKSSIWLCMEYCCHVRDYAPSCNLEMLDMLDMLQERLCWTAGPAFTASFESLAHRQNKASLKVVSATFLLVCF